MIFTAAEISRKVYRSIKLEGGQNHVHFFSNSGEIALVGVIPHGKSQEGGTYAG